MQEKMIRFLNSIGIKDTTKYDMDFISIYKDKGNRIKNKYRYYILKDSLRKLDLLLDFLSHVEKINDYDYEFIFTYKEKFSLSYISEFLSDFIYSKTFDDYDTYLHLNSKLKIFFNSDVDLESFELIKKELENLFSFVCYNLPIEVGIYDEKEIYELKNKKNNVDSHIINNLNEKIDNKSLSLNNSDNLSINKVTNGIKENLTGNLKKNTNDDNFIDNGDNVVDVIYEENDLGESSSFFNNTILENTSLNIEELKKKKEEEFMELNKKTIKDIAQAEKESEEIKKEKDYKREIFKKSNDYKTMNLEDIDENSGSVDFIGKVFESEIRDIRDNKKAVKLGITNLKSAVYVTLYPTEKELNETNFNDILGKNIEIKGKVTLFKNAKEFTITVQLSGFDNAELLEFTA